VSTWWEVRNFASQKFRLTSGRRSAERGEISRKGRAGLLQNRAGRKAADKGRPTLNCLAYPQRWATATLLMDQADDNWLTALLMKRAQVRFREIVNTCTERRAEKRIQRTA